MDIEKTIEFILNEQAKTEAMRQKNEEFRLQNEEYRRQNEERWKKADERFEKKIAAINKLMVTGMKMIAKHEEKINILIDSQARTDLALRELAEAHADLAKAQQKTEQTLDRFIESMRNPGSNGKKNGRH